MTDEAEAINNRRGFLRQVATLAGAAQLSRRAVGTAAVAATATVRSLAAGAASRVPGAAPFTGSLTLHLCRDAVFTLLGLIGVVSQAVASGNLFQSIDVPGVGASNVRFAINNSGQAVGTYPDAITLHSFLYSNGSIISVDPGTSLFTEANGLNDLGQVTGFFSAGTAYDGFVYSAGVTTQIDVPGANATFPEAINASGQVAGIFYDSAGVHAFLDTAGSFQTIDVAGSTATRGYDLNDSGQITGYFDADDGSAAAYVYSAGVVATFSGQGDTVANAINANGWISGYIDDGVTFHGFLAKNGAVTQIDVPGALETFAESINSEGQVAGFYDFDGATPHGFVYDDGVFTLIDVPGASDTLAYSINDLGQVSGTYDDASGTHAFIATIPEPASLQLILVGLTGLGLRRRVLSRRW